MEFLEIEKEYGWVIKVLESCVSVSQIDVTEKLFNNFIKKWSLFLSDERKTRLRFSFDRLSWAQSVKIKKNMSN